MDVKDYFRMWGFTAFAIARQYNEWEWMPFNRIYAIGGFCFAMYKGRPV
jgi:hypothetical protein